MASVSCQWHMASWPFGESERRRENSNFREVEMTNIMTEAVSDPKRDIVERVAASGRTSGQSREQKDRRYELNQKDSEDRGPPVPSERGDRFLRHYLCPQQTDRIW